MPARGKFVVLFSEVDSHDIGLVGEKGAYFGEMVRNDFPVPEGFIVSARAHSAFLSEIGLSQKISELLSLIDFQDTASITKVSGLIKKLIVKASVSETLKKEIFKEYKKYNTTFKQSFVSLFPSLLTPDQSAIPLSTQDKAFSNISGEASMLLKIKEAWSLAFSESILMHCHEKFVNPLELTVSVTIQKDILQEKSGTMYTSDPSGDKKNMIIRSVFGSDDIVNDVNAVPDTYVISKNSLSILEKKIGYQDVYHLKRGDKGKLIRIAKKHKNIQKITNNQIMILADLGKKVEKHFFFPQEIHWAIEKKKVYILTIKPLTPSKGEKMPRRFFDFTPSATKIYLDIDGIEPTKEFARQNIDGIGVLRVESLVKKIGIHPKKIIRDGKRKEFIEVFADHLEDVCQPVSPRPVLYRSLNLTTDEYRGLAGGKEYEPKEPDAQLGFRGAFRSMNDPEGFQLELDAIKYVRTKKGLKNLWMMLSFVRNVQEFVHIKKMIVGNGLFRSPSFHVWLSLDIPANIYELESFIDSGIDGVAINSDTLGMLLSGTDRSNSEVASEFHEDSPSCLWAYEHAIRIAHKHAVPISMYGEATSLCPSLVERLIELGISGITIKPEAIESTRKLTHDVEQDLVLNKGL